jgi:hypothetical protein
MSGFDQNLSNGVNNFVEGAAGLALSFENLANDYTDLILALVAMNSASSGAAAATAATGALSLSV